MRPLLPSRLSRHDDLDHRVSLSKPRGKTTAPSTRKRAANVAAIEHFAVKYRADLACDGPMAAATQALAERVKAGERIVCLCWCWPKPCHGTLIIDEIKRRLE
jgi:hypothetical protein